MEVAPSISVALLHKSINERLYIGPEDLSQFSGEKNSYQARHSADYSLELQFQHE